MIDINSRLTYYKNPSADRANLYPQALEAILDISDVQETFEEISSWPGYESTALVSLAGIAEQVGISCLWYKDESTRFGLGSFKALGGAYAVFVQLKRILKSKTGNDVNIEDLLNQRYSDILSQVVVSCATDGNHGRSVAWGAELFGCQCIIYIHSGVSEGRKKAIEGYGSQVIRITGNYDESVRLAALGAEEFGRIIVSDTSYAGYMEIPKFVALGYTVMLKEIVEQLDGDIPTHVILQGGVGGLASAVCAFLWQYWGVNRPRFVIVEPEAANCLQQSARAGKPVAVEGDLSTCMAGLACGEVSLLAWEILSVGIDDFMTISEGSVAPCMRLLASGHYGDKKLVAGESAVAGVGVLLAVSQSESYAKILNITRESRVLVVGTEGATDPDLYEDIMAGRV